MHHYSKVILVSMTNIDNVISLVSVTNIINVSSSINVCSIIIDGDVCVVIQCSSIACLEMINTTWFTMKITSVFSIIIMSCTNIFSISSLVYIRTSDVITITSAYILFFGYLVEIRIAIRNVNLLITRIVNDRLIVTVILLLLLFVGVWIISSFVVAASSTILILL